MKRLISPQLVVTLLLSSACAVSAQTQNESGRNGSAQSGGKPYESVSNFAGAPPREQAPADPRVRAKVHTELAAMYLQGGHMAVALEEVRIAIEADSRYAPAYSVRGLVHAYLHENEEAETQFRKALDLTPNDPEVNNNYGWFLCQSGKGRQSIAYFLNALKSPLYATPEVAYTNAGGCALKAGDLDGAESYLRNAIRLSRDGAEWQRTQLALVSYRRGNLEEARRLVNGVLKDNRPSVEALWLALRTERKLGNRNAEGALAAQLRNQFPDSREYQDFLKGNFE